MEDGSHCKALIIKSCFKSAVDFPAVLSWGLSSALLQRHTLQLLLHSSFFSYSYCRQSSPYRYIADCLLPGMQSNSVQLDESQHCIYSKWVAKESCPIWHYCSVTVLPQMTTTLLKQSSEISYDVSLWVPSPPVAQAHCSPVRGPQCFEQAYDAEGICKI